MYNPSLLLFIIINLAQSTINFCVILFCTPSYFALQIPGNCRQITIFVYFKVREENGQ